MSRLRLGLLVVAVFVAMAGFASVGDVSPDIAEAAIGADSCQGEQSCVGLGPNAEIGDNSCNGYQSCVTFDGTTGDNSCNGYQSCVSFDGTAGDNSCNGYQSCVSFDGTAGNNSCRGYQTCVAIDAGISIGDDSCFDYQSCVGPSSDIGDCEFNAGCSVVVTKTANPSSIPASGGTVVQYVVAVDVLEDIFINSIRDDQYPVLVGEHCEAEGPGGQNLGAPDLPDQFQAGSAIVCTYAYALPSGVAGTTYDNVATVNVGLECPVVPVSLPQVQDLFLSMDVDFPDLGVQACSAPEPGSALQVSGYAPGEVAGTVDVTAEASVLYVDREREERRPPNIGAGLSGLFNGMPTPLPTAPSAVAPAATSPVIRPPNTGDAGLVREGRSVSSLLLAGVAGVAAFGLAAGVRARSGS